jgi:putative nucleotidyltransferase with HDIG domain
MSSNFVPSRNWVIANLERVGLSEERISHSIDVADLASRIAQNMIKERTVVDRRVIEAGALFHDIGLAKQPPELWSAEHGVVGAFYVRGMGCAESVALCVDRHEGHTRKEAAQLKFPFPENKKSHLPVSAEEKIVAFADMMVFLVKAQRLDPWHHPEVAGKEWFHWASKCYKKVTGKGVSRDHLICKRANSLLKEIIKFCPRDF